jgi:sugar phosphate isomerase/epimerase
MECNPESGASPSPLPFRGEGWGEGSWRAFLAALVFFTARRSCIDQMECNPTSGTSPSPLPFRGEGWGEGLRRAFLAGLVFFTGVIGAQAAPAPDNTLFARSNLVAWCIVPFDAKKRGPEERAAMMERLGIKLYAYDYRAEHIPTFDAEMEAIKRHGVSLTAWWFPGGINDEAQLILDVLQRHKIQTQLWISGGGAPTKSAEEQAARVEAEAKRIRPIAEEAAKIGCSVALYNHGGWFGEPENQIEILERLKRDGITNVGLVYNQHHGHDHIDRFAELLQVMKPYLLTLNLNGMTRNGDRVGKKILPLAQGDLDLAMLKIIRESGWRGPIGILNHTDEDAEARLLDNIEGLEWLVAQLDGKPAGPKPQPRSWREPAPPKPAREQAGGLPSLSDEFGKALSGGMVVEGKPEYRNLPVTIELRAKLNSRNGFNILAASDPKASSEHWELYSYAGSGVFSVFQPGRGGEVRSEVNICDGQWHYLAAILEPDRVRLYVNGKLVKDAPAQPLTGTPRPGGLAFGGLVEGGIGCDGLVDDVRISKGVREIRGVPGEPLKRDDRTIDLWNFDELPAGVAAPRQASVRPAVAVPPSPPVDLVYVKKNSRDLTRQASVEATSEKIGLIQFGEWQALPRGATPAVGPNGVIDFSASVQQADGTPVTWSPAVLADAEWQEIDSSIGWLYRVVESERDVEVTLFMGGTRPITTRFNGGPLLSGLGPPGWLADQIGNINEKVPFQARLKPGKNFLSIQFNEPASVYFEFSPLSAALHAQLEARLDEDFPATGEAAYYRIETIRVPEQIILEVGGMDFTPDGKLMVCTRRGEIWSFEKNAWTLFASGLQEPLGLWAGKPGEVFVVQRSELTRVADTTEDGQADRFETITAECGVSDSGHAFIFGPVRDSKGNFWGTISHMGGSSGDYYGWSFKVTPEGEFFPWSSGFRSPNGIGITPEDEVFVSDNQGEWVGTSPLHHVSKGAFHGHPGGLKWDPNFKGNRSNIDDLNRYRKPAAILFPYGSMGQSTSEPRVDTTGGKFGPFAGQMFVGDQTKSTVMRVSLERVDGEFQGACYPFRSGFQSGINRMVFAPDGSLYVGQTDRGWGSLGGKSHGLQRTVWTGRIPFEIHTMSLTATGFELRFTKPVDRASAGSAGNYSLQHYYYLYRPQYGSPQMGNTAAAIQGVEISPDGRTVRLKVAELVPGKIYELNIRSVQAEDGSELLHPVAYYTLNRLIKETRVRSSNPEARNPKSEGNSKS